MKDVIIEFACKIQYLIHGKLIVCRLLHIKSILFKYCVLTDQKFKATLLYSTATFFDLSSSCGFHD